MRIGTVSGLWRYPVKSTGGERLESAVLTWRGIPGDRGWAVYDELRCGWRSRTARAGVIGSRGGWSVDNPSVAVEGCPAMFAVLRSLAPAVLLIVLLSGQAATGIVLAHVASEHVVRAVHEAHHAADHHAADHASGAEGGHGDADPGPGHTHQIVPATAAATARIAHASMDAQPCLAVVGQGRFDRFAPGARNRLALPVPRAGPPEPQRHSILLL